MPDEGPKPVIELPGLKRLIRRAQKMDKDVVPTLVDGMEESILYLHQEMPEYPPEPPTSTYTRKGTLGRTVSTMKGLLPKALSRVEKHGSEVVGVLGTALEYAPWVIDEDRQAGMHKGRWWTLQGHIRDNIHAILSIFGKHLRALIGGD